MNILRNSMIAMAALTMGLAIASCEDANEYEDARTDNPSWVKNYNDSMLISHPDSLAQTKWVRKAGLKTNAFGEDVQGFVESLEFVSADSVKVIMSQGATEGTFTDDSNTEALPLYEYSYNANNGRVEILKRVDNNGKVTKNSIFMGTAVIGTQNVLTIVHYGDTPAQTYLEKQ